MSKKQENPFLEDSKKKHHLWGLWVPLIVIGCLLLPVAILAMLFYDTTHFDTGVTEPVQAETMFGGVMRDMLDNCRNDENPAITLGITQKQLNGLLLSLSDRIKTQAGYAGQFIKQLDVQIKEDAYYFDIEVEAWNFIKTRISVATVVAVVDDITVGEKTNKTGFAFSIKDVRLGRIGGFNGLVSSLLSTDDGQGHTMLDNILENLHTSGLSIKYDKANKRLTYALEDFANDIASKAGSADPTFTNLFKVFFDGKYITFNREPDVGFSGNISMAKFKTNTTYYDPALVIDPKVGEQQIPYLTYHAEQVQQMLNDGLFSTAVRGSLSLKDACNYMHQYLCYGDEFADAGATMIKGIINSDPTFSTTYLLGKTYEDYGAYAKLTYFGNTKSGITTELTTRAVNDVKELEKGGLTTLAKVKAAIDKGEPFYIYGPENKMKVTDKDIHDLIKANPHLAGYGFPFVGKMDNNLYKFSYTMLDNVYTGVYDNSNKANPANNELALTFDLNVNGCKTSLVLSAPEVTYTPSGPNYRGITFSISEGHMYYGNEQISSLKSIIQKVMGGLGSDVGGIMKILKDGEGNVTGMTFEVNFSDLFNNASFISFDSKVKAYEPRAEFFIDINIGNNSEAEVATEGHGNFNIYMGYRLAETL